MIEATALGADGLSLVLGSMALVAVGGLLATALGWRRAFAEQARLRAANERLRESEQRLQAIFDQSGVAMAWVDPATARFVRVNSAYCALTGYSEAELLGMTHSEVAVPEARAGDVETVRPVFSGEINALRNEKHYLRKDGSSVWGLRSLAAVGSGSSRMTVALIQDITARKEDEARLQEEIERRRKLEASLQENEARFRDFAEIASDWLYETDDQFRTTAVIGERKTPPGFDIDKILGKTRWEVAGVDPTSQPWADHIRALQQRQHFRDFQYQLRDSAGQIRWLSVAGRPIWADDGSFLGYRGTVTDLTGRKKIEADLEIAARQQKAVAQLSQIALRSIPLVELFEAAAELIASTLAVHLVRVNELSEDGQTLRLVAGAGWGPGLVGSHDIPLSIRGLSTDALGEDAPIFFQPGDAPGRLGRLAKEHGVVSGMAVGFGDRARRFGSLTAYSTSPRHFTPGDADFLQAVGYVLGSAAEQRIAEETARLQDRALRAITQSILITSAEKPDQPLIYVNPEFERMTGYRAGEVLGHNCRFLQGEETDPEVVADIRRAIDAEQSFQGLIVNYRKDGSSFFNELTIAPVRNDAGITTHFVGIASDVSERVSLEAQLRQAQKMEAVGHLTGGIAHDFNNLLAVILGNAEILWEEIEREDLKATANLVLEAAERGAELTERLLAFGRRQTLRPQPVDLARVVDKTTELLRRTIGDRINLRTHVQPDLPAAVVDRPMFESAILNLVVNARDAMPGGGTMRIELAAVREDLRPAGLAPGRYVAVSVSDSGSGMPPEVVERVFEPFFTTKEVGKGSGLGLPMVYGFAEQSGGHVAIDSEVGRGTRVTLYLPQAEGAATPDRPGRAHSVLPRGAERILVVEDEADVRRFVAAQLASLGYKVEQAGDGEGAVRALREDCGIDLLFTDLMLRDGMNGLEVADRAVALRPDLKILLTSGYSESAVQQYGSSGVDYAILKKPYRKEELAQAVRSALDGTDYPASAGAARTA